MTKQEAIKELQVMRNAIERGEWICSNDNEALDMAIEALTAQPELHLWQVEMVKAFMEALDPDWILCSKELPPDDRTVLVTLKWSKDDYEVALGEYWHDSPSSKGWGIYEGHVIAWMPLPEPYKDGDENG